MRVGKTAAGRVVVVADDNSAVIAPSGTTLTGLLHAADPSDAARRIFETVTAWPLEDTPLAAPLDRQEVWAAGVTYTRSKQARMDESEGAARFYDLVYEAERPELFFKAPARRVVGPGGPIRVRRDSAWSVPEPELTLVLDPRGRVVGYTAGNDVSARDVEGENPLYLPQAKVFDGACAVGPLIRLGPLGDPARLTIGCRITRAGAAVFEGETTLAAMRRRPDELADWLFRELSFPDGALLMTGTGVVPPDGFTLRPGDTVAVAVAGAGTLENTVADG